jgi:flagellar motor switch protein FliM
MADILSQDEVNMLLSAVSSGEVSEDGGGSEQAAEPQALTAYDFRRPDRVSKEQLKGLQSLFEAFSREMSVALPPFLRTVVRVELVSIDQLTYDEFILSISRPTAMTIIDMTPLEGNAVIELNPGMVFPIVDRALGGKGAGLGQTRELTEIENRIVNRVILMLLDCLKRSWEQLIEFKLSVVNQESDPLIVQIVAGSEMVILVGYEIHLGDSVGAMNMCIPLMVLNPVLDKISQQTKFTRRLDPGLAQRTQDRIASVVKKAPVNVDAILGRAQLPLKDLARLQVGDVIQLDTDMTEAIAIEISGQPQFTARPGRRGDQSAIQVTEITRSD